MSKFDLYSLQFATSVAQEGIERLLKKAELVKNDSLKNERLLRRKCSFCYYVVGTGIVLQGFHEVKCCFCEKILKFGSSDISNVCSECSDKYNICVKCKADLDLKERRSLIRKKK